MGYSPENNPYIPGDPYSYDLKWIVAKIKEWSGKFTTVDAALKALANEFEDLKQYVDDLNVTDAVNEKLDEMYADGTLAALIGDYVSLTYYQKTATLNRVGRFLDRWGYDSTPRLLYGQSCCYNNNLYYVCGSYNSNANQNITVWNSTGAMLNSNTFTQLGHANDICYLNGYLYVATGTKIAVVDAATLTFVEYVSPTTLNTVRDVATDGEKVYMAGLISSPLFGVESYDPNNGNVELLVNNLTFSATVPQGSEIHDGYMYFLYNRAMCVLRVNMTTWEKDFIYNIPESDTYYYVGEAEDLLMVNGRMYLWSAGYVSNNQYCSIGQLFDTDIVNALESTNYYSYIPYYTPERVTVNGNTTTVFNPFDSFNTIEEVCLLVPSTYVRVYNLDGGAFVDMRGRMTTMIGISGTRTLGYVEIRNGSLKLDTVGCNSLNIYCAEFYARGSASLIFNAAQYSKIELQDNSPVFQGTIERSVITIKSRNGANQTVDFSGATGQTQTMVEFDVGKLNLTNFSSYAIAAIKSAYGIWANAALIPIACNLILAGNIAIPICIEGSLSQFNSGFTVTCGDAVITVASDGTVTATYQGAAVTPLLFGNVRFFISNN